jgi:hypothetical protein
VHQTQSWPVGTDMTFCGTQLGLERMATLLIASKHHARTKRRCTNAKKRIVQTQKYFHMRPMGISSDAEVRNEALDSVPKTPVFRCIPAGNWRRMACLNLPIYRSIADKTLLCKALAAAAVLSYNLIGHPRTHSMVLARPSRRQWLGAHPSCSRSSVGVAVSPPDPLRSFQVVSQLRFARSRHICANSSLEPMFTMR